MQQMQIVWTLIIDVRSDSNNKEKPSDTYNLFYDLKSVYGLRCVI